METCYNYNDSKDDRWWEMVGRQAKSKRREKLYASINKKEIINVLISEKVK